MISKRFLDQGIKIREDYINIKYKLNDILEDIQKTANKMEEYKNDFIEINDNMEDFTDLESVKKTLMDKLTQADAEGQKLAKVYEPINKEMEGLKNQEESLYRNIKETYPDLSDEDIVKEFEPYIKKLNK